MPNYVTKKDGTRIAFSPEKMQHAIIAAGMDAGVTQKQAEEIAKEVSELVLAALKSKEEVSSDEIRERILAELDILHPAVAEAWKKYEETKGI